MSRNVILGLFVLFAAAAPAFAKDDLVWQTESGEVRFWSMKDGQRAEERAIETPIEAGWRLVGIGNVDGDRGADMIWRHENGDVRYQPVRNGAPGQGAQIGKPMNDEWTLVGIGDLGGTRSNAIIWTNRNGLVDFWSMERGRFLQHVGFGSQERPEWRAVGVGDVDFNGSADIIFQHKEGQVMFWRMNKGVRQDSVPIERPAGGEWRLAGVGDVNGDDFDDLVWQNPTGALRYSAMFDGRRMGDFDIAAAANPSWRLVGIGDIDRVKSIPPAIPAPPTEYGVPVETLSIEKARGRFMETAFSVGGYIFATSIDGAVVPNETPELDTSPWRTRKHAQITFRFMKADGAVINSGTCSQYQKNWSRFWNRVASLHACQFETASSSNNALEVYLPKIVPGSNAAVTVIIDEADGNDARYNVLRARLRYNDVVYEATPTGLYPNREGSGRRVAKGYSISRDGELIGRIDFPEPKGVFAGDAFNRLSVITAPVEESAGREAVIFFASQLNKMPEVATSSVSE
jgi:hypothetical protein